MKRTTQTGVDEFLKLNITRARMKPSFLNRKALIRKVDALPVEVQGDCLGAGKHSTMTEEVEVWAQDPVDCIKELIGNTTFQEHMSYAPVHLTRNGVRKYSEMCSEEWWWDMQKRLPAGAVVAPVILASDKMQLSVFGGDKTAWPPSAHATTLLGYIPVAKLECFEEKTRSAAQYHLFHHCMSILLKGMEKAGREGVQTLCADGHICTIFPVLAAYVTDYPEQCLIACCKENRCPRCVVDPKAHANVLCSMGQNDEDDPRVESEGLRPVYSPFWADLPHTDIFACFSPDILHQLHKGVFKDHFLAWCTALLGKKELDRRFQVMSGHAHLRHFKDGISGVSQWTGKEQKEMEKIFVGLMAGAIGKRAVRAARAFIDFVYYAQYQSHTEHSLARMKRAFKDMHENKDVFVEANVRKHFNIPKFHALVHYVDAIRSLGSLDGFNTEASERLHIDYAKKAYRATNRRDYVVQMTTWLQRQEVIVRQNAYLHWVEEMKNGRQSHMQITEIDDIEDWDKNGDEEDDDNEDNENGDAQSGAEEEYCALRQLVNSNVTCAYQLTKQPTFLRVSMEDISSHFGARDFARALELYLIKSYPGGTSIRVNQHDRFDIYGSICLLLPASAHVSNEKHIDKVRATPAMPHQGHRKHVPAHFDTALIIRDCEAYSKHGGLSGLQAAQVRVIFRMPQHLARTNDVLAYVQWFRPFRAKHAESGYYVTEHSTRNNRRHSAIVNVDSILRSCHLIPEFGGDPVNPTWTPSDVLDKPITYHLNSHIDFFMFEFCEGTEGLR
ncbi:uncharacterized protein LAESUDRAFT_787275 [Laetiporus sulphureus 93-53]|uniref:CxC2-like cysteine cluster KDZ transposase-associated domain-containing protein n=1 Tax=Laetiporus sulphureus 93-53 TaxID=1314785 RepID=A0A165CXR5_9APHY|nr:uncharacterized protein LAESUDRAFT_787275 [Laetiporus sulphureus 93-53]KZT03690.1 hypothetical protein LAESUDRAFT_787275 [Laetiporus sulphureus 93-53]